jgi:hypothetical protein
MYRWATYSKPGGTSMGRIAGRPGAGRPRQRQPGGPGPGPGGPGSASPADPGGPGPGTGRPRECQLATASSNSLVRPRVRLGSTGMPGPIVVVTVTFLRYRPLAAAGLSLTTSSIAAA